MEYSGCKPFVDEVIEESTKEFGAAYALQPKVRDRLYAACELVDEIVPELDCDTVDVSVNTSNKQFTIMVICDDMVLEHGRTHKFFQLIKMVNSFAFSKCGKESLRIELNIDGLWEKTSGQ